MIEICEAKNETLFICSKLNNDTFTMVNQIVVNGHTGDVYSFYITLSINPEEISFQSSREVVCIKIYLQILEYILTKMDMDQRYTEED